MKMKKIISACVSASMLLATLPIVNAFSATVTSELSYYNSEKQSASANDAAYTKGEATIEGISNDYSDAKYIVAGYTDSTCGKLTGLQMATFTSDGTNYIAETDYLDTSSSQTVKEFFLNGSSLAPIANAKATNINAPAEVWTVNVSWQSGPFASTGADFYNKYIRNQAATNPTTWSKYDVDKHVDSQTTSFELSTVAGTSSWIFNGNCFACENDNGTIMYSDCDACDYTNRTVTLRIWAQEPAPTPTPTGTPVPTIEPGTYKFEAENYSTVSEGGTYKTSLYFASTAAGMSGNDGLNLAAGSATYNVTSQNVPAGTYTMTIYGACYDSTSDLGMGVTASNTTVATIPASKMSDYSYDGLNGNISAVTTAQVTVTADGTIKLAPINTSQWIMVDYFTLKGDGPVPTPVPTMAPGTYKFEAESYSAVSAYGNYKTSQYFASTAAGMSGNDGLNLGNGNAVYDLSAQDVPEGSYTMTIYGACVDSASDLVLDIEASNTTTASLPASQYTDYLYNGIGNISAVSTAKVAVESNGMVKITPQNASQWVMIDYFTLSDGEVTPTIAPTPTPTPAHSPVPTDPPIVGDDPLVVMTQDYLNNAPSTYKLASEYGYNDPSSTGNIQAIMYDSKPLANGSPTKVYAYIGFPENASTENKVPAVVCVHGATDTAMKHWVEAWNARGYAAISMDLYGTSPIESLPGGQATYNADKEKYHGIYDPINTHKFTTYQGLRPYWMPTYSQTDVGDMEANEAYNKDVQNAGMYQNVASIASAFNILRDSGKVNADQIGLVGMSWGGVTSITTAGLDSRYAFVIPIYGCGHFVENETYFKHAFDNTKITTSNWDPKRFAANAKMPVLMMNGNADLHFSANGSTLTFNDFQNETKYLSFFEGSDHGGSHAVSLTQQYDFADYVIKGVGGFINIDSTVINDHTMTINTTIPSEISITGVKLYYLNDVEYPDNDYYTGHAVLPSWSSTTASASGSTVTAEIPTTAHWVYATITDSNNHTVSTGVYNIQ